MSKENLKPASGNSEEVSGTPVNKTHVKRGK
jgi:hypothetical protein